MATTETMNMSTSQQQQAIHMLARHLQIADVYDYCSDRVNRHITSTKQLSRAEANTILYELGVRRRERLADDKTNAPTGGNQGDERDWLEPKEDEGGQ